MALLYFAFGIVFGFVLSRSGAADYNYIQAMFLFTSFQLYGIIGTAIAITAPGLWLIKRHGRTLSGRPVVVPVKPRHRGNIAGGILFGIGWSICGMSDASQTIRSRALVITAVLAWVFAARVAWHAWIYYFENGARYRLESAAMAFLLVAGIVALLGRRSPLAIHHPQSLPWWWGVVFMTTSRGCASVRADLPTSPP